MLTHADDTSFGERVLKAPRPVLVDFWAAWCAPCRMVGPIVERLAQDWDGVVDVVKVDVDAAPVTAETYRIRSIPTLAVFRDGKILKEAQGALPEPALRQLVESAVPGMAPAKLSPKELEAALAAGAVVYDLRAESDWRRNHIPGSRSAPADRDHPATWSPAEALPAAPGRVILVDRTGELSAAVARGVRAALGDRVAILGGGIFEWEISGRKLQSG